MSISEIYNPIRCNAGCGNPACYPVRDAHTGQIVYLCPGHIEALARNEARLNAEREARKNQQKIGGPT